MRLGPWVITTYDEFDKMRWDAVTQKGAKETLINALQSSLRAISSGQFHDKDVEGTMRRALRAVDVRPVYDNVRSAMPPFKSLHDKMAVILPLLHERMRDHRSGAKTLSDEGLFITTSFIDFVSGVDNLLTALDMQSKRPEPKYTLSDIEQLALIIDKELKTSRDSKRVSEHLTRASESLNAAHRCFGVDDLQGTVLNLTDASAQMILAYNPEREEE